MSAIVEVTQPWCETIEIATTTSVLYDISGPPLAGGSGASGYVHTQSPAASVWTITHDLGYDPAGITVIDGDGNVLDWFVVQYMMSNVALRLSFDISVAGTAYLS